MPRESMTPLERWQAVLQRRVPDRVPMDYWATSETHNKLKRHLGIADDRELFARLHIDTPLNVDGRFIGPQPPADTDIYGIRHRDVAYEDGTYREAVSHPLAQYTSIAEIEANYSWPSADWWDYAYLPALVDKNPDRPVRGGGSEPFLLYKNLRGQEQAFIDLVDNPEIVHYCLDKLFELAYQNTLRIYEALPGRVHISYVAEDMGSQEGLMFSPVQIHEFLLPRMRRMIELAHQAGVTVFHHSDGAITKILPDMIAAGIDVLNPIQWRSQGMERERLKANFGDQLIFHGAVDNQFTLPFGTPADVRQEVADNLRILGAGGGYILAPCHNIQAVSPAENIVAMYEAGYELGWS
ncbi:MAG: uroporphyrinogen-III decarboxylase-like protein [Chloroflexi bacterium]|nr:uroporphyrinogen-III decarboxylase-like protein [Chloroflexota bacterium]